MGRSEEVARLTLKAHEAKARHAVTIRERDEALAEVERLRECMRRAGLAAFLRDRSPEDVAEHLHQVMQSYTEHIDDLELDAEMACIEPADNCRCAGCLRAAELRGER
jgi:hypothetical protein